MESYVHFPSGFKGSIKQVGAASPSTNPLLASLRFAMGTIKEYTKLPDIFDYDAGEVYDIKPRRQIKRGISKVCWVYTAPFNIVAPKVGLNPIRPGMSTWPPWPSPVYFVPPDSFAFITQCPGLIIYDLYDLRAHAPLPAPVRVPAKNTSPAVEKIKSFIVEVGAALQRFYQLAMLAATLAMLLAAAAAILIWGLTPI